MIQHQPVEEHLVGVLQAPQVDMALQVLGFPLISLVSAGDLAIEILDVGRQETKKPKLQALVFSLGLDRKSTRLNSSHVALSRMPSSA
jgi:hypothetical protein